MNKCKVILFDLRLERMVFDLKVLIFDIKVWFSGLRAPSWGFVLLREAHKSFFLGCSFSFREKGLDWEWFLLHLVEYALLSLVGMVLFTLESLFFPLVGVPGGVPQNGGIRVYYREISPYHLWSNKLWLSFGPLFGLSSIWLDLRLDAGVDLGVRSN